MNILFMCVANSARSQLAEGLARDLFGSAHRIESAGSAPSQVNPAAITVLREAGVDAAKQFSKSVDDLAPGFLVGLDFVIALCAEQVCPVVISKARKLHWPLPDPAGIGEPGSEARLQAFRATRDEIRKRLEKFKMEQGL
jgi:arsenate reductase